MLQHYMNVQPEEGFILQKLKGCRKNGLHLLQVSNAFKNRIETIMPAFSLSEW